ncbi:MAG: hypothetical protein OET81_13710, partial [Desulfobacteraceae bacterium]|nr:hypothetical protein [Desulfobacteraceae bacterium]
MSTRPTKQISMSRHLTRVLVLTMTIVVVLVAGGFYLFTAAEMKKTFNNKIEQTLTYLEGTIAPMMWNVDHVTASRVAQTVLQDDLITGVIIWDELGQKVISIHEQRDEVGLVKTKSIHFQDLPM